MRSVLLTICLALAAVSASAQMDGALDQEMMQKLLDGVSDSCRDELMTSTDLTESCKLEVQDFASTMRPSEGGQKQQRQQRQQQPTPEPVDSTSTKMVILTFTVVLLAGLFGAGWYINQQLAEAGVLDAEKKKLSKKKQEKKNRRKQF